MSKVAVVTGGSGFIGSHLCEALIKMDLKVYCFDNLITGREENISHLQGNSNFKFINHDVTQILPIVGTVDFVFHLASPASVPDYQAYPEETALVNSVGTRNVLQLVKAHNARFLYASTSEVYGDPKEHPQKESYWGNVNPIGIRSCYDEAKRFGEMMTLIFVRKYGIDARIIRIFNTYGPKMRKDDGRVVSNFINQALENKPLTVYGDGSQTRSICYVSDLVNGILKVMFKDNLAGEVFNLGNQEEFTMNELAQKIKKMVGSQSEIVYKSLPFDDPRERRPDISKVQSAVGWTPMISADEGLQKTIEYYKNSTKQ